MKTPTEVLNLFKVTMKGIKKKSERQNQTSDSYLCIAFISINIALLLLDVFTQKSNKPNSAHFVSSMRCG